MNQDYAALDDFDRSTLRNLILEALQTGPDGGSPEAWTGYELLHYVTARSPVLTHKITDWPYLNPLEPVLEDLEQGGAIKYYYPTQAENKTEFYFIPSRFEIDDPFPFSGQEVAEAFGDDEHDDAPNTNHV